MSSLFQCKIKQHLILLVSVRFYLYTNFVHSQTELKILIVVIFLLIHRELITELLIICVVICSITVKQQTCKWWTSVIISRVQIEQCKIADATIKVAHGTWLFMFVSFFSISFFVIICDHINLSDINSPNPHQRKKWYNDKFLTYWMFNS